MTEFIPVDIAPSDRQVRGADPVLALVAVARAARDFIAAYRAASIADEEGLATVEDWKAAWAVADGRADELDAALARLKEPQ